MTAPKSFTLSFLGDVMLGRLLDQLFPQHVTNDRDQPIADTFIKSYPSILANGNYTPSSPWGSAISLLRASDLCLINLETSVTTTSVPWPDKVFNYRMHPANLAPILHAAHVDYASLANNHTLDFGTDGLVETVWSLREAGVAFAGAGETTDQAYKPAVLWLPRQVQQIRSKRVDGEKKIPSQEAKSAADEEGYPVHVYSAADHPRDWSVVPTFHLIDYSPVTRARLRTLLLSGGMSNHPGERETSSDPEYEDESDIYHHREHHHHHFPSSPNPPPALKIFSIHWGPNYRWHPAGQLRSLAHFLIDECEVDIVHGHSSHHVQGVEVYHGKIIIYGCGDFVDDYALNEEYRNDLGAVWRVIARENGESGTDTRNITAGKKLVLDRLEIFPTRVDKFRAMLLDKSDVDHSWVSRRIKNLSLDLGTSVREVSGEQGQLIIDCDQ
ncbi:Capsule synthesis protein CapA [Penicillium canariense]|uniref:Capsule synthesis protein CapA n=1 Tax=Penicillium canariense TaxID=189055 RepID=A0A9W9LK24_9EURO|nr:Capsule synthesis protein CapA [Penicillium canariense]KAJ5159886.1 Capsule synthesis protein CapA [Penicillium canariense]